MTLRLYNTLTRAKEDFAPLDPQNVRMYVCGPTVYDFAHIGNARPVIVFDLLFRLLRHLYGEAQVTYVRNVTDIDDKINARAQEVKGNRAVLDAVREITSETGRVYREDVAALGCLPPTHEPRATEYVPRMIALIEKLIATGFAYEAEGHVLFDVSAKADYGKLAHRSLDEMIAGARVDVAPYKRGPMDFVLWKPSDETLPGWDSPWGRGRPGWHIECSAMGEALLGETFDIHGGGIDLVFPHHENEIAQSEGVHNGHALARVWMHNGFLNVQGEKMSKSLGNFRTIRELLHIYPGDVLRFQMLGTHYRRPIDWTYSAASQARSELLSWADLVAEQDIQFASLPDKTDDEDLLESLYDDLNTPLAITRLREKFRQLKREWSAGGVLEFAKALKFIGFQRLAEPGYFESAVTSPASDLSDEARRNRIQNALAYQSSTANNLAIDAESYRQKLGDQNFNVSLDSKGRLFVGTGPDPGKDLELQISALIESRNLARKARDFKEADRIRDELLQQDIQLKDNPDGTTSWEVKR